MIGRVYKVQHLDSSLCYIGSTCNTIRDRWRSHKSGFKKWISDKDKYSTVALYPYLEQYGVDRFQMILVKEYQVADKQQLRAYEQLAISRTSSCCNKNAALQLIGQTCMNKHYYQFNKPEIREYNKEYYQANKQAIGEKRREFYQENKPEIREYNKEYYQANKQAISEMCKDYYQANKKTLQERARTKVTCECGTIVSRAGIAAHRKSAKHARLLAALSASK